MSHCHSFTHVNSRVSLNNSCQVTSTKIPTGMSPEEPCQPVNGTMEQAGKRKTCLCSSSCFWYTGYKWSLSSFVASGHQLKFNLQLQPSVKWGNDQRSVFQIWMCSSSYESLSLYLTSTLRTQEFVLKTLVQIQNRQLITWGVPN